MKQCDKTIKELLPLYADGELTKEEKALVDEHILACSDCNEELELYQMMHDEFFLDDVKAPEGFHEDLMNRLDIVIPVQKKTTKQSKSSIYYRYNKYINVAAMLVFVMLLSIIGLTQGIKWNDSYKTIKMDTATESAYSAEMAEAKEESVEVTNEEMRMGVNAVEASQEAFAMEAPLEEGVNADMMDVEALENEALVYGQTETGAAPDLLETGETLDSVNDEAVLDDANKEKSAKILIEPQEDTTYTTLATQSPTGPSWTLIVGGLLLGVFLITIVIFLIRKHYFKK